MSRRVGSIKWFGGASGYPAHSGCIGEIVDRVYEQVLIRSEASPACKDALLPGTRITYEVVKRQGYRYFWAHNISLLDNETDLDLLKRCFDSVWPQEWQPVVRNYFADLSDADIVDEALRKAKSLQAHENLVALLRYIPERVYNLPTAKPLLELRIRVQQNDLHERLLAAGFTLNPPPQPPAPSPKVVGQSANSSDSQRENWAQLLSIFAQDPLRAVAWSPSRVYGALDHRDYELASLWTHEESHSDHEIARVLSARAAELVARWFYRSLGHEVTDIAVTQLDKLGKDWLTHDMLLDKTKPVDVKNARTPVSQRDRYVEHCVPAFKETRDITSTPVGVAGVLSPYLRLEHIRAPANIHFPVRDVTFLGETSWREIESLVAKYESTYLTIAPVLIRGSRSHGQRRVIPPWLYDYPSEFYLREAITTASVRSQAEAELPSDTTFTKWRLNPLPILIASNVPVPESWVKDQEPCYSDFVRRLHLDADHYAKLPNVFLAILTHFLDQVCADERPEYSPSMYERLLYLDSTPFGHKRPLGLYDPLEICWALCSALKTLWKQGVARDIVGFRKFRFHGMGLLRGTRQDDGQEVTLLAYCGGIVPNKGKCGYSPLIWGLHNTCPECHHLICPECSFCSDGCLLGQQRVHQTGDWRSHWTDEPQFDPTDRPEPHQPDILTFDEIPF